MHLDRFALATSALLFILIPTAAPAQTSTAPQPDQPNPVPTIQVSAREVIVDVVVTDSSGKPVHGLQQSDFTVQEDGSPQIIRSFYESTTSGKSAKPVPLPVGEYTNSSPLPAGGPVTILLLDMLNGYNAHYRNETITRNLNAMPQGTPVGIFGLAPSGLHTLQNITTDRDLLIRALKTDVYDEGDPINLPGPANPVTEWTRQMTTLRGLNQLAAYLSGVPGRKNLFWFGLTMPVVLTRDGGYSWGLDPRSGDMSLVHHSMDTYEMLTAARIAVYPVMASWLWNIMELNLSHLELEKIAEDFGTVNISDSRDPNAIANAANQASQYYTLSYIPPKHAFDGHFHTISVIADKPGLTLSYRKGYDAERTPTLEDPAPGPELLKASLEGNSLNATQILFDAAIRPLPLPAPAASNQSLPGAAKPAKAAKVKPPKAYPYQIRYGLPASQIAFREDESGQLHGAVEFDIIVYDVNRTRVALLSQIVNMPLGWEQFDQFIAGPFNFTQQIDLPPGQLWIHAGILDTVSNRLGTLEFPLVVGTPDKFRGFQGVRIIPPGSYVPPDNPLPCPMPCNSGPDIH